ncbi:hypothetical protein EJB05_49900, partial [Eragrostis curvula]
MATAAPMRPSHLAVVGLGLAYLLLLPSAAATTTELLHASVLPHDTTLTLAGRPVSSHHGRASSTSTSTTPPDDNTPRRLDVSAAVREDSTAPAPTATAAPSPRVRSSCPCVRVVVDMREAAVDDLVPAPCSITAAATRKALLLRALPLLAVPFLPTPLAAVVALSTLATPVRAGHLSTNGTCPGRDREHATCTVYRYHPGGCVDRSMPFNGLRKVCHAGADELSRTVACACRQGRLGHPFQSSCHVSTLELYDGPARINWRVLAGDYLPIADPAAAAASGEDVCYVELERGSHREGYYIPCPVRKCPRLPFLCCPEFPNDAAVVAAA